MGWDINCDLGEGKALTDCEADARLMPHIQRCNIACGAHAGSPEIMQRSIENALEHRLLIGAHPGYADKANFGRKSLPLSWPELQDSLAQQLETFFAIAHKLNARVSHIKLHGALYNDAEGTHLRQAEGAHLRHAEGAHLKQAEGSSSLAQQLADFFKSHYPDIDILCLAQGKLANACAALGLSVLHEGFMDRAYQANGLLVPRSKPGAVHSSFEHSIKQALDLAQGKPIQTLDGSMLKIKVDSICLHGDTAGALSLVQQLDNKARALGLL